MTAIVEFLSAELFNTDKFIVIDVSQRENILSEMEFSMQGCTDESCALEIGKLLSAERIVVGNLSKVGSRYLMSVKMLETETSKTMGTANGKFRDLDELIDGLETIAAELAGEPETVETAQRTEAAVEAVPEPPVETVEVAQPLPEASDSVEQEKEAGTEPLEDDTSRVPDKGTAEVGVFNLPGFLVSAAGAGCYAAGGFFSNMGFSTRLAAEEAYDVYMTAVSDPGQLYAGGSDYDYQQLYDDYERNIITSYSFSGTGAVLSAASSYIGDSYLSFAGRLVYILGTTVSAAGNFLSVMSANTSFDSLEAYDEYLLAGSSETASTLWYDYADIHDRYRVQQFIGYSLWGTGGLLTLGSWLIPGEKTPAASGLLEKIILTAGYLSFAGGNFTGSIAINKRFSAEDAYGQYLTASSPESTSELYKTYQDYQEDYQMMSALSYGLWAGGAAAVITAMLLPSEAGSSSAADAAGNIAVRPSPVGFGFEVEIQLK